MYRVIIGIPEDTSSRKKRSELPSICDLEIVYEYKTALWLNRRCYIAAEIEGSKVAEDGLEFDLGDNSTVGGYINAQLEPETSYNVTVSVVVPLEVRIVAAVFVFSFLLNR